VTGSESAFVLHAASSRWLRQRVRNGGLNDCSWILLAAVNGFFATTMLIGSGNVVVVVFSLSGIVVCTAGITWVMYGVMDRY
jgi:hypothetical protein